MESDAAVQMQQDLLDEHARVAESLEVARRLESELEEEYEEYEPDDKRKRGDRRGDGQGSSNGRGRSSERDIPDRERSRERGRSEPPARVSRWDSLADRDARLEFESPVAIGIPTPLAQGTLQDIIQDAEVRAWTNEDSAIREGRRNQQQEDEDSYEKTPIKQRTRERDTQIRAREMDAERRDKRKEILERRRASGKGYEAIEAFEKRNKALAVAAKVASDRAAGNSRWDNQNMQGSTAAKVASDRSRGRSRWDNGRFQKQQEADEASRDMNDVDL